MSSGTRLIKTRLKSIRNTKKVTKAMELVAGAKMRRAVERALASRQYAVLAWQLAGKLSGSRSIAGDDYILKFFRPAPQDGKWLLICFASNRGLCGAYNSNVLKQVFKFVKARGMDNGEVAVVGKRLVGPLSSYGIKPSMAYEKDDTAQDASSVVNMANYAYEAFKSGRVDSVYVAYSRFKSALVQEAVVRPLFPFQRETSALSDVERMELDKPAPGVKQMPQTEYTYEPMKRKVLSYLIPRLGEAQMYEALLESNAAEHSARMLAMKSATDAAGDMLDDLTLQYNRARQAGITKEIAEISAGMAAVT